MISDLRLKNFRILKKSAERKRFFGIAYGYHENVIMSMRTVEVMIRRKGRREENVCGKDHP